MSRTEIIAPRDTGGVLDLGRVPAGPVALYNRASSGSQGQYGRRGEKLRARTLFYREELRKRGRLVMRCFYDQEKGYVTADRPLLEEAAEYVRRRRLVALVAPDLSRFIRPESYDPITNPDARATPEEFDVLCGDLTKGVRLATFIPPDMTPAMVHRWKTLDGNPGRPRQWSRADLRRVLEVRASGVWSIRALAEETGFHKNTVARMLDGYHLDPNVHPNASRWKAFSREALCDILAHEWEW